MSPVADTRPVKYFLLSAPVDWQPDHISWYVDGVKRRTDYTDAANIPHEKMYVLLNLAVGGDWPGAPNAGTPLPSNYDVDWVRIWQRA